MMAEQSFALRFSKQVKFRNCREFILACTSLRRLEQYFRVAGVFGVIYLICSVIFFGVV